MHRRPVSRSSPTPAMAARGDAGRASVWCGSGDGLGAAAAIRRVTLRSCCGAVARRQGVVPGEEQGPPKEALKEIKKKPKTETRTPHWPTRCLPSGNTSKGTRQAHRVASRQEPAWLRHNARRFEPWVLRRRVGRDFFSRRAPRSLHPLRDLQKGRLTSFSFLAVAALLSKTLLDGLFRLFSKFRAPLENSALVVLSCSSCSLLRRARLFSNTASGEGGGDGDSGGDGAGGAGSAARGGEERRRRRRGLITNRDAASTLLPPVCKGARWKGEGGGGEREGGGGGDVAVRVAAVRVEESMDVAATAAAKGEAARGGGDGGGGEGAGRW
eukprot:scaffold44249_cov66-Phaeocystis_antarctica.AAC.2